jgi:hypothetical protein
VTRKRLAKPVFEIEQWRIGGGYYVPSDAVEGLGDAARRIRNDSVGSHHSRPKRIAWRYWSELSQPASKHPPFRERFAVPFRFWPLPPIGCTLAHIPDTRFLMAWRSSRNINPFPKTRQFHVGSVGFQTEPPKILATIERGPLPTPSAAPSRPRGSSSSMQMKEEGPGSG